MPEPQPMSSLGGGWRVAGGGWSVEEAASASAARCSSPATRHPPPATQLTGPKIAVEPFPDELSHGRGLLVAAVEQLDPAIGGLAVLGVQGQYVVADALDAVGRRQGVLAAVQAQPGARHDQLVDLVGLEVLEQAGHVVVDAVPAQVVGPDQGFV